MCFVCFCCCWIGWTAGWSDRVALAAGHASFLVLCWTPVVRHPPLLSCHAAAVRCCLCIRFLLPRQFLTCLLSCHAVSRARMLKQRWGLRVVTSVLVLWQGFLCTR